ncbi:hypothetical protein BKA70DRAFT_1230865 [Coprinopsis sp. MPI-PUGE-AT-0042]|nr:hypothetical protein BKA70DRAFT_1230865 [Coprinopsis sp. MPI-PUGE-AT-0042]
MSLHKHLETFLSDSDKKILGFSTIFVEHILCKVVRFNRLCGKVTQTQTQLAQIGQSAAQAEISNPWRSGENKADKEQLPFPTLLDSNVLDKAITEFTVLTMWPILYKGSETISTPHLLNSFVVKLVIAGGGILGVHP